MGAYKIKYNVSINQNGSVKKGILIAETDKI